MASAFSGIIAYGFYNMKGLGNLGTAYSQHVYDPKHPTVLLAIYPGLAGWRWIVRKFMISLFAQANIFYSSSCKAFSLSSSVLLDL
jgi:hypothetical protein